MYKVRKTPSEVNLRDMVQKRKILGGQVAIAKPCGDREPYQIKTGIVSGISAEGIVVSWFCAKCFVEKKMFATTAKKNPTQTATLAVFVFSVNEQPQQKHNKCTQSTTILKRCVRNENASN